MKKEILNRVLEVTNYIISTKDTIRNTAKIFKVSKSTIHKDISDRLMDIDYTKYLLIEDILKSHIETRHILGGQSTKLKYEKLKLLNER